MSYSYWIFFFQSEDLGIHRNSVLWPVNEVYEFNTVKKGIKTISYTNRETFWVWILRQYLSVTVYNKDSLKCFWIIQSLKSFVNKICVDFWDTAMIEVRRYRLHKGFHRWRVKFNTQRHSLFYKY